jgi:hypothetical protein
MEQRRMNTVTREAGVNNRWFDRRARPLSMALGLLACSLPALATDYWRPVLETKSFYLNEPVSFGLKNVGTREACLPNAAPWQIKNANGSVVYSPVAAQQITCVSPGKTLRWAWGQRDNNGSFVKAGDYAVAFGSRGNLSLSISRTQGSSGLFTFRNRYDPGASTFRLLLTDPRAIRAAIEGFYGLNSKFPSGVLVNDRPGRSPWDSQWSWHLEPSSISMEELTMELCDGRPEDIEADIHYWMRVGRFCPWHAKVIDLK